MIRRGASGNGECTLWNFPCLHTLDISSILTRSFSTDELFDVVKVVRLRAHARTSSHNIRSNEPVKPINRLHIKLPRRSSMDRPTDDPVKPENVESQSALIYMELDKLVPNLIVKKEIR